MIASPSPGLPLAAKSVDAGLFDQSALRTLAERLVAAMEGPAFSIQDPVEAECVKFTEHNPSPHMHALSREHLAHASEWQLVLQIDSDTDVGMEWGDVGRLYLCARKQDLAARRFDRCWTVLQCY